MLHLVLLSYQLQMSYVPAGESLRTTGLVSESVTSPPPTFVPATFWFEKWDSLINNASAPSIDANLALIAKIRPVGLSHWLHTTDVICNQDLALIVLLGKSRSDPNCQLKTVTTHKVSWCIFCHELLIFSLNVFLGSLE